MKGKIATFVTTAMLACSQAFASSLPVHQQLGSDSMISMYDLHQHLEVGKRYDLICSVRLVDDLNFGMSLDGPFDRVHVKGIAYDANMPILLQNHGVVVIKGLEVSHGAEISFSSFGIGNPQNGGVEIGVCEARLLG